MGEIEVEGDRRGVATVWLDNPGRLNALSNRMIDNICEAMEQFSADAELRAIVLRGRGGAFCAGRDLNDLAALQEAKPVEIDRMYDALETMNRAIRHCPHPTISVVERYALGIATMMVTWTDITIVEEDARLGYPEVRHGITPFGAVPTMLNAMPWKAVMDLLLTGRTIDGREALTLGIASRAVPAGKLDDALEAVLSDILAGSPAALAASKHFVRECETLSYSQGISTATAHAKRTTGGAEARARIGSFLNRDRATKSQ
jgi:enoyl-CoA hydratase/carnithine racemase